MTDSTFDSQRPIDIICMGRLAVDLYAEQVTSPLEDVQTFQKYLGGCAANIAVGTSRLGLRSAMFSRVGSDDMGKFLRKTLTKEGVDTTLVQDTDHLTALAILGVNPPDRFPLIFYRENCADMQIRLSDIQEEKMAQSKALLVTGTGFSSVSMYAASMKAIHTAKKVGTAIVLDLDYRPVLWGLTKRGDGESRYQDAQEVTQVYHDILPWVDLIVGTEEEVLIAGGGKTTEEALQNIRQQTSVPLVLKKGEQGCEIFLAEKTNIHCPPFPVVVLNVLGAGDAFMSGFLCGWLRNEPWEVCGQYGNANGAIVVSRHGCAPAMATFTELAYFMSHYQKDDHVLQNPYFLNLHRYAELGEVRKNELLVLAYDHRWQLEQSCEEQGQSQQKITEFKQKIFEGFQKVVQKYPDRGLSILVDPLYGQASLKASAYQNFLVGVPIEAAGKFPLEWISTKNLYQELLHRPSNWYVKVLWNFHINMDPLHKKQQMERLHALNQVCNQLNRRLMLELIIPDEVETSGTSLSQAMQAVYEEKIYPYWWKIAPVDSFSEWEQITQVLDRYDAKCGIVLLGQNAKIDRFHDWFSMVRQSQHTVGFAIGRSIFWELWELFIRKQIAPDQVIPRIAQYYETLIQIWDCSVNSDQTRKEVYEDN